MFVNVGLCTKQCKHIKHQSIATCKHESVCKVHVGLHKGSVEEGQLMRKYQLALYLKNNLKNYCVTTQLEVMPLF